MGTGSRICNIEHFYMLMNNSGLIIITGIIKTLTMPLITAWLVYVIKGGRKKYIYRFLFVLPVVVPGVVMAMTWQKIYDPNIGRHRIFRATTSLVGKFQYSYLGYYIYGISIYISNGIFGVLWWFYKYRKRSRRICKSRWS